MTLLRSIATGISFFIVQCASSQFIATAPLQHGIITEGEYGNLTLGTNRQSSSGTTWYCTWDASNLYIALSGSTINEAAVLYSM
jgi:hypothetical protein